MSESTEQERLIYLTGQLVGIGEGAKIALDAFCAYDPTLTQIHGAGGERKIQRVSKLASEIMKERTEFLEEELEFLRSRRAENEKIENLEGMI